MIHVILNQFIQYFFRFIRLPFILVLVIFCGCCSKEDVNEALCKSLIIAQQSDTALVIHPFLCDSGLVVLLPHYWSMDSILVSYRKDGRFNKWIHLDAEINKQIKLDDILTGGSFDNTISFFKSDLNTIFLDIDSNGSTIEDVNSSTDKSKKASGTITEVDVKRNIIRKHILKSIKGRGNSTWGLPQKPYNIKLDKETKLFDTAKNTKSYCLLSLYNDFSGVRNYLAYKDAIKVGMTFSVSCSYTNVFINGYYNGLYLLTDKISTGKHTTLYELENNEFYQDKKNAIIKFGGKECAVIKSTGKQIRLKQDFGKIFSALYMYLRDKNPNELLSNYIDIDSWVDYYISQEVFMNMDAGLHSFYVHISDSSNLIKAGPLWDMDNTLSTSNSCYFGRGQWNFLSASVNLPDDNGFRGILGEIVHDEEFRRCLHLRYPYRRQAIKEMFLGNEFDSITTSIKNDILLSQKKWGINIEYDREINFIKDFVIKRLDYLDQIWAENKSGYKSVIFDVFFLYGGSFERLYPKDSACSMQNALPTFFMNYSDGYDYYSPQWINTKNDSIVDIQNFIYRDTENMVLKSEWKKIKRIIGKRGKLEHFIKTLFGIEE